MYTSLVGKGFKAVVNFVTYACICSTTVQECMSHAESDEGACSTVRETSVLQFFIPRVTGLTVIIIFGSKLIQLCY